MAREFCEDFRAPVDPMTGQPYPGLPPMANPGSNQPSGGGRVVIRDDGADCPPGGNC